MRNSCPGRYYADGLGKLKVIPIPVTEQLDTDALKQRLIGFSLPVVGTKEACTCLAPEQDRGEEGQFTLEDRPQVELDTDPHMSWSCGRTNVPVPGSLGVHTTRPSQALALEQSYPHAQIIYVFVCGPA